MLLKNAFCYIHTVTTEKKRTNAFLKINTATKGIMLTKVTIQRHVVKWIRT